MKINILLLGVALSFPVFGQDHSKVEIKETELSKGIYMLEGAGGNIGVSIGEDGTFMIDDQFAPLSTKIESKIKSLSGSRPKFILNTHWHADHTGGNENFGKSGSVIVAHENVRKRLKAGHFIKALNGKVDPAPKGALPVVTFTKDISFHLNGEKISVLHLGSGHTDGDSVVHFEGSNVIHMGDLFFNKRFPFIDVDSGGGVDSMISTIEKAMKLMNGETKIIPGHGPLASLSDLKDYIKMLKKSRSLVSEAMKGGKSIDEVVKMNPLKEFAKKWSWGFVNEEKLTRFIYTSLKN